MQFGGGQTAIALAVAFGISPFAVVAQQPSAPTSPPSVDVKAIMNFCSGQTTLTVPGNSRGNASDKDGYTFQFNSSKDVEVTRNGTLMYRVEKPTLEGMADCVAKIYKVLALPPIPEQKQCRIPQNGIEKYNVDQNFSGNSNEMSGGHTQPEWCSNFTATLQAGHGVDRGRGGPGAILLSITDCLKNAGEAIPCAPGAPTDLSYCSYASTPTVSMVGPSMPDGRPQGANSG
jgi:hypothetical protein